MPRLHRIDILHNSRCKEYHTQSLNSVFAIGGSPIGNEKNKKEARPGWIKEQDKALIVFFFPFLLHGRNYCRGQALRRHAHTGEENINKKKCVKVVATDFSVSPRPVPTSHLVLSRSSPWREFAEDIEGVTRTPLCSSFLYFFLFFSSPQEIWRVGEKHKNHHIKHAALSCSPECLNQAPTRPQPFSNCTIMPYANNSYFLDKPVDPNALCKPSKKCTTKPTLKSKSKKEFTQQNEGRCGLLTANNCCTA